MQLLYYWRYLAKLIIVVVVAFTARKDYYQHCLIL